MRACGGPTGAIHYSFHVLFACHARLRTANDILKALASAVPPDIGPALRYRRWSRYRSAGGWELDIGGTRDIGAGGLRYRRSVRYRSEARGSPFSEARAISGVRGSVNGKRPDIGGTARDAPITRACALSGASSSVIGLACVNGEARRSASITELVPITEGVAPISYRKEQLR